MHAAASHFANDGFLVSESLLAANECERIAGLLSDMPTGRAGTRCMLHLAWCVQLAQQLRSNAFLSAFLADSVATQCTLFEKTTDKNWLVTPHQDLSIPVARRVEDTSIAGWSVKEGVQYVHAPVGVLEQLIAVRLHVDLCDVEDGPLRVVPASHLDGRLDAQQTQSLFARNGEVQCPATRGSVMLMKPLLLHASSKATGNSRRRVLHFLFGPRELPSGLHWHHAR